MAESGAMTVHAKLVPRYVCSCRFTWKARNEGPSCKISQYFLKVNINYFAYQVEFFAVCFPVGVVVRVGTLLPVTCSTDEGEQDLSGPLSKERGSWKGLR